jgi:copper chaperone
MKQDKIYRVEGMKCGGCAAAVKSALESVPGVEQATVSLEEKSARVVYDDGEATPARLRESVEAAGFHLTID